MDVYAQQFRPAAEEFRKTHFPEHDKDEPVILHREEIKERKGPFTILQEENKRLAFDAGLLSLIGDSRYKLVCVVLDKRLLFARYGKGADPHSRCLWEMLDGYSAFLESVRASGDVMGEARQPHLDRPLAEAYRFYWNRRDQQSTHPNPLKSKELKLKPKALDILGTQLADLLAYPTKEDILRRNGLLEREPGAFTRQVLNRIHEKYLDGGALFLQV